MMLMGLLLAGTAPAVAQDVLAPARNGLVQCYEPDVTAKTCRSIAAYRQVADQSYVNTATVLLSPTSLVTLETDTLVVVKNGAVCGAITLDSLAQGKLRVSGRLLDHEQAKGTLGKIQQAMASFIGKEICTTYTPSDQGFAASVTMDGSPVPNERQHVIWVKPDDGYVVSPAAK